MVSILSSCILLAEGIPATGDYTGGVQYNLGDLAAGDSKTVKVVHRVF